MFEHGIKGVDFVICNTDLQALEASLIPTKIQLGKNLTEGLGAGSDPDVGMKAAQESSDRISELLDANTKMLFITAGMGGGTGTGAAPVIAEIAREKGILTIAVVTHPFANEGGYRKQYAKDGLEELKKYVDTLLVINNDKLIEIYGDLTFTQAFGKANEVLNTATKGIAEVISQHMVVNIDLNDARKVLENSGTALMGQAIASGENRAIEAVTEALDSPLLNDNDITGAEQVLLKIVSGEGDDEIRISELEIIKNQIQKAAGRDVNIIEGCLKIIPGDRAMLSQVWSEMDIQLSNYVRGKVLEIFIVGVAAAILFASFGLNYGALLAVLVGLSVLIPFVGAFSVTIPIVIIGLLQFGLGTEFYLLVGLYLLLQFIDGNLLVPIIFSEAVKLHPIIIILAVFIFGSMFGFWGVFFSIPLATFIKAVWNAWPSMN